MSLKRIIRYTEKKKWWQFWKRRKLQLDEIYCENANIHIEDMGNHWCVIVEQCDRHSLRIDLGSRWGRCGDDS